MAIVIVVAVVFLAALFASRTMTPSVGPQRTYTTGTTQLQTGMIFASPVFKNGERIPSKYTCDSEDVSPPLTWNNGPQKTITYALIVDDLDAPIGVFTHWVIFNLPATDRGLQENVPPVGTLPNGALQGSNDFGKIGYGGPCPPAGTHRYVFHIYSLDTRLNLPSGATKQDVLRAMEGHILAEAELMGLYSRG